MTDIELKLNAWTGNSGTTVFCVQGEQQARTLHITLIDRTGIQDVMSVAPVTPRYIDLTGYTPRMYVSKPDGTGVYFPGTVTDAENGRVDFTLTGQCVAVPGKANCTISLIKEDIELKIVGIVLDIKKSDTDDFIEGSKDEFVELEVLTSQAKEATAECIAATEKAEQAVEAANEVVQESFEVAEEAKNQAASAKEAATSANAAAQSANSATSSAQSAADRANAAADRVEETDVGGLATNLDNHVKAQANSSAGVHGIKINGSKLELSLPDGKTLLCKMIEEESESGIWHYIKYADGTAECWGTTQTVADCSTPMGNWFIDFSSSVSEEYPFEFVQPPVCIYSINGLLPEAIFSAGLNGSESHETSVTTKVIITSPAEGSIPVAINWSVIGRWK